MKDLVSKTHHYTTNIKVDCNQTKEATLVVD